MSCKDKVLILIPTPFYSPLSINNYVRVRCLVEIVGKDKVDIFAFPYGSKVKEFEIKRFPRFKIFKELNNGEYFKIFLLTFLLMLKFIFMKKSKYKFIFSFGTTYFFTFLLKPFYKDTIFIATAYAHLEDELIKWNITNNKLIYKLFRKIDVFTLNRYDKVVLQSEKLMDDYIKYGLNPEKAYLIKHAIARNSSANFSNNNLFKDDLLRIIYSGSFVKVQNIELIIEVAELLRNESKIKFILIGANDLEFQKYSAIIHDKDLTNIEIIKRKLPEEIEEHLNSADILISTRTYGYDTPLKIFDYLSRGKCILATDKPIHNLVLNKDIACLVEPDKNLIAEKIIYLKENRQILKEYGEKAIKYFNENYSFQIMKDKYLKLLNEYE